MIIPTQSRRWSFPAMAKCLLMIFCLQNVSLCAHAEILGYSQQQLSEFWEKIGGDNLPLEDYVLTLNHKAVVERDEPDKPPCPNIRFCRRGIVPSATANYTGDMRLAESGQPYLFRAYELSEALMSTITSRRLVLNMFLAKTQQFKTMVAVDDGGLPGQGSEPLIADYPILPPELLDLVFRAHSELFFIQLLDYVSAAEISAKCQNIRKADTHYQFVSKAAAAVAGGNSELERSVNSVYGNFKKDLSEKLVCRAVPLANDNQLKKMIEKRIDCEVSRQLWLGSHCDTDSSSSEPGSGAILKTIVEGMNSEHTTLGSLERTLASVEVSTLSGGLFDLETQITNYGDNLDFLTGDLLGLKGTTQEMLEKIKGIESLPDANNPPVEVLDLQHSTDQLLSSVSSLLNFLKVSVGATLSNSSCLLIDPEAHQSLLELNCAQASSHPQCSNQVNDGGHCFCRCLDDMARELSKGDQLDFQPNAVQLSADIEKIDLVITPQN